MRIHWVAVLDSGRYFLEGTLDSDGFDPARIVRRDGVRFDVEALAAAESDALGEPVSFDAMLRELTARARDQVAFRSAAVAA